MKNIIIGDLNSLGSGDYASDDSSLKTKKLENLLTTKEVAEFLNVPEQSIWTMASNGQLPVYKLGRRNRYKLEDLRNLLEATKRGGNYGN